MRSTSSAERADHSARRPRVEPKPVRRAPPVVEPEVRGAEPLKLGAAR